MVRWLLSGLWLAAALEWSAAAPAAEPIAADQFDGLRAAIRPQRSEESWLRIPWLTSLTDARRKAAAEGKPILLWEMDGHPLGCT